MKPGKGLTRRTGLTARKGLSSSTGLSRTTGLSSRVPAQRSSPPPTAPKPRQSRSEGSQRAAPVPQAVRDAVVARDGGRCVRCSRPAPKGNRQLQHRLARGMGSRDGHARLSNLILLCGMSATDPDGCHYVVEARPTLARLDGYRVPMDTDPSEWPVLRFGQWVLLDDDGSVTPT